MSNALSTLTVLIAPLALALAAYFGHIVLRGTKVSELRQKWIDDQREDLAVVVSRAHVLLELRNAGSSLDERKADALEQLEAAAYRIKLRENPRKPEWTDVIERVGQIRALVRDGQATREDLGGLTGGILPSARNRLKLEWNLVRDGERSYQRSLTIFRRWVVTLALVALVILLTHK